MRKSIISCSFFIMTLCPAFSMALTNRLDSLRLFDEVVVTGTRSQADARHLSQTITTVDHTKLTENYRQNILPTLMEQVPGLIATSRGMMGYGVSTGAAGGLMLRGISSGTGQLMVLIDGHPQYNGIYGHSIADAYQTMMTGRVEVLRGPASMLYGSNAMGGVINIITRGMQKDGVRTGIDLGAGSWGTIQAEASNQVRKGRFSSSVAAQYCRSDNHRPNMGFQQFGGYAKLGYDFTTHWKAFADADVTHFASSNPGILTEPKEENDQYIMRYALNLVVENRYDDLLSHTGIPLRTSGAISLYDNFGRHKINDGYNPETEQPKTDLFRSKDAVYGVNAFQSLSFSWSNPTTLTAGFDYQHIYGHAWYTNRETGEVVTTKQRLMQSCDEGENEYAGYVELRQEVTRLLTVEAGLRVDHHTVAGTELVPQFGLTVRPIESGQLKLSASKGFRNPTTKDMYLYGSANSDSLRAERMWNYELSWSQHLFNRKLIYGVNVFYINADNIIQTVNKKNVNTGHLENDGAELEVTYKVNRHWSVNTNHSYLHMENPVVSAPTYKGYLGVNGQYGKWSFCAGLMQVCGLYTELNVKSSNGESSDTKESFTLLNATVSYQPLRWMRLWVKGDNLLAQRYQTIAGMPMPRATFMGGISLQF